VLRLPATVEPTCGLHRRSALRPRFPASRRLASSANLPAEEHIAYSEAIERVVSGKYKLDGRRYVPAVFS